jgi:SAM-dependent methyltransferase
MTDREHDTPLARPDEIRHAYSRTDTAEAYIEERFRSAWGAVLHSAQTGLVNDVIRRYGVRTVLEIAPGPARLSADVSGFERGYLCEYNDSMISVARRRLPKDSRWTIVRGDGFHVPFQPGRFDLAYTFRFIRHSELPERTALYRQIRDALAPRGLFIFDAVNVRWRRAGDLPIHDALYSREELLQELRDHGFTPLSLTDVIKHLPLQHKIQILIGPRSRSLANLLIRGLERIPGSSPLEWVVVCQRT